MSDSSKRHVIAWDFRPDHRDWTYACYSFAFGRDTEIGREPLDPGEPILETASITVRLDGGEIHRWRDVPIGGDGACLLAEPADVVKAGQVLSVAVNLPVGYWIDGSPLASVMGQPWPDEATRPSPSGEAAA
jgi:hypothetical protein